MGTAVTTLRAMAPDDVPAVAVLEAANQARGWSEKIFRDELAADSRTYLVAEVDGAIAGFGGIMVVGDEAHVTNLLVDPDLRRGGLGRALMVALITVAVESGARHLTLEVRKQNDAARALYSRFGLAPVGVRPRYYGDDDALILWAHDIDAPEFLESLK